MAPESSPTTLEFGSRDVEALKQAIHDFDRLKGWFWKLRSSPCNVCTGRGAILETYFDCYRNKHVIAFPKCKYCNGTGERAGSNH